MVIEHNTAALKRVVAALAAMAGLAERFLTSPSRGREASGGAGKNTPTRQPYDCRPPLKGEVERPALPRHLRNAVLRLLRPAEAAARRLIVVAARDLASPLRPFGPPPKGNRPLHHASHGPPPPLRRGGTCVAAGRNLDPPLFTGEVARRAGGGENTPAASSSPCSTRRSGFASKGRRTVPPHLAPRIAVPGITRLHRLPPPPSPDDPIDVTRVGLRLAALAAALDDLPQQARRLVRLRARRARGAAGAGRLLPSPLRPGRAPGLPAILPRSRGRWPEGPEGAAAYLVHDLLADLHFHAADALRPPDTS